MKYHIVEKGTKGCEMCIHRNKCSTAHGRCNYGMVNPFNGTTRTGVRVITTEDNRYLVAMRNRRYDSTWETINHADGKPVKFKDETAALDYVAALFIH